MTSRHQMWATASAGLGLAGAATWTMSAVLPAQLSASRLTQVALIGLPVAVLGLLDVADGAIWLLPEAGRRGTPTDTRTFRLEGPPGPDPKRGTQRPSGHR